jgi:hypothetical protein
MISRKGPTLLECQREMVERGLDFERTQAALVLDFETRAELDAERESEFRYGQERSILQEQIESLNHRLAEEAESREKEKEELATKAMMAASELEEADRNRQAERRSLLEQEARQEEKKKQLAALVEELENVRAKAEEARRNENSAMEARIALEREISTIESSSGWTPRFIVQNNTELDLHLLAYNSILANAPAGYQNCVRPKQLVAFHALPGRYGFEGYLQVADNPLGTWTRVSMGIGAASWLSSLVMLGLAGSPVGLAGTSLAAITALLWQLVVPKVSDAYKAGAVRLDGFQSNLEAGQDCTALVHCAPGEKLREEVEVQMLTMEATRQGKDLHLFHGPSFGLGRTTRLRICGGPEASKAVWDHGPNSLQDFTKYTFKESTEPIRVERVDNFNVDD